MSFEVHLPLRRTATAVALWCLLWSAQFGAVLAAPGTGVIAIYYQTEWSYPITASYIGDGLPLRNATMQMWWGPEKAFQSPEWKYVEIAANELTTLYFSNASGAVDNRDGADWQIICPGIYVLYNDTSNETLKWYWAGCPGVPPENVLVECSAHGTCNEATYECVCDGGWGCPACECNEGCVIDDSVHGEGPSNTSYPQVYTAVECCTKCSEIGLLCAAANYNYETFTCEILSKLERIVNMSTQTLPYALVYSPLPTPSPIPSTPEPTTPPPDGDEGRIILFIIVGVGAAVLLAIGVVGVRIVTGQQRQEAMMRLLASNQQSESGRGVFEGKYRVVRILGRGAFGVVYLVAKKNGVSPQSPVASGGAGVNGGAVRRTTSPDCGAPGGSTSVLTEPLLSMNKIPPSYAGNGNGHPHGASTAMPQSPKLSVLSAANGGRLSPMSAGGALPYANPQIQELFAMKVIHCTSEEELGTAFSEFQSLRRLQGHDNIVAVVDMFMTWEADAPSSLVDPNSSETLNGKDLGGIGGIHDGDDDDMDDADARSKESQPPPSRYLCIVMEYMSEGPLDKAIREDPAYFSTNAVLLSILRQILLGIAFSHKRNIIHRDLKPGNVLLSHGRTRAVLTDFGLARDLDHSATERGGAGTLPFLAPEQMDHRVSKKSDIWAVACIGVAMATARHSTATRAMFILRNETTFEEDLRKELKDVPNWLQDLLLRMFETVPLERPTADECVAEFDLHYDPAAFSREASEHFAVHNLRQLSSPDIAPATPYGSPPIAPQVLVEVGTMPTLMESAPNHTFERQSAEGHV